MRFPLGLSVSVFFLFLTSACGPKVTFTPTNTPIHSMHSRPVLSVEVYSSHAPKRRFQEVGVIKAQARSGLDDAPEVLAALRKRAAKEGCDAVVLNGTADAVVASTSTYTQATAHHNQASGDLTLQTNSHGGTSVTTLAGFWAACVVWEHPRPKAVLARNSKRAKLRREPMHRPALRQIRRRVEVELLREGISLDRLNLAMSFSKAKSHGLTVALIERSENRLVRMKAVQSLPRSREAKVAHLVVVVRSLVDSMNADSSL